MNRTVFILDDEADVRETLRTILVSGGYNAICFADQTALLEATRRRCPLVILLDVDLPGRSGVEILKDLVPYSVPVIMISDHSDIPTVVAAIKDGALDFIQKPLKRGDILDRLEQIVIGASSDPSTALQQRMSLLNFPGREPLTLRERDVLQLAATGASNKKIGEMLGISYRTVEDHRSNIMHKLDFKNFAELMITVLK